MLPDHGRRSIPQHFGPKPPQESARARPMTPPIPVSLPFEGAGILLSLQEDNPARPACQCIAGAPVLARPSSVSAQPVRARDLWAVPDQGQPVHHMHVLAGSSERHATCSCCGGCWRMGPPPCQRKQSVQPSECTAGTGRCPPQTVAVAAGRLLSAQTQAQHPAGRSSKPGVQPAADACACCTVRSALRLC